MKTLRLGLFSLFVLFLFSNCEKEQSLQPSFTELSEEQKAMNALSRVQHSILFVALELNHETSNVSGYIIDKKADLRKVEMRLHHKFDQQLMPDYTMRQLHENSTLVEKVDPIIAAEMLRKTDKLSEAMTVEESDQSLEKSKLYYSFSVNDTEPNESCEGDDHHLTYYQLLINGTGRLSGQNSDEAANDLLNWLRSLEGEEVERQGK